METAVIALIGTLFGGVALKIIEHILNRGKHKEDLATSMRKELREELASVKQELRDESKESEEWKSKYWELKAELLMVNHKTNKAVQVIDNNHPEEHLGEELEGLEFPGGRVLNTE